MSEEVQMGLTIMAVGMITVFAILGMVVLGGKIMIVLINKFAEETPVAASAHAQIATQAIENAKISVLASIVTVITKGKGKITKIKKL
ncbi:MAG: OadG family transporter subunit [Cyclobacteriaceae bacterium]|nr:OadG family transporter subunit [Cyclobacteriaceae bacterium]